MLKEKFLGRNPSHFQINSIVKTFILSEAFLWSAWNFLIPLFAIFVIKDIPGGTIQDAATGYSIYLVSRVIFELISGKILVKSNDKGKIFMAIFGIFCLSIGYAGFIFSDNVFRMFLFYTILGIGLGVASPAKNSLFSIHLDKNKEATEWSLSDAVTFICMAMATVVGGAVITQYGFKTLFVLSALINLLSIIPYLLLINSKIIPTESVS